MSILSFFTRRNDGSAQAASAAVAAPSADQVAQAEKRSNLTSTKLVGSILFLLIFALATSMIGLTAFAGNGEGFIGPYGLRFDHGQVLVLAVIVAGALGGCIHVGTSFSDYVGTGKYKSTWQWWYLLRPPIGAALALTFYFLIRGGLLSLTTGQPDVDPSFYGMAGISFLVGMFSKQATDKLDDVFDTLFKSNKDNERTDGIEPKLPVLKEVSPPSVPAGSPAQKVTIMGLNLAGGTLKVDGVVRAADLVQDDRVEVTFTADELDSPTKYLLTVVNGMGAADTMLKFVVTERRRVPGTPDDRGTAGGDEGVPPAGTVDTSGAIIGAPAEPATVGADAQPEGAGGADPAAAAGSADAQGEGGDVIPPGDPASDQPESQADPDGRAEG